MGWNSYYDAPLLQKLLSSAGIPPIDSPAFLYQDPGTVVTAGNGYSTPQLDASAYQSLNIYWQETNTGLHDTTYRTMTIAWFSAAGFLVDSVSYLISASQNLVGAKVVQFSGELRRRAPFFTITVGAQQGPSSINGTVSLRILGSYRAVANDAVQLDNVITPANALTSAATSGTRVLEFAGTTAAVAATFQGWPRYQPGDYLLCASASTTAATLTLNTVEQLGREIFKVNLPNTGVPQTAQVHIPASLTVVQLAVTAVTGYTIALTRMGPE